MLIKPYKNDLWFRLKQGTIQPDRDSQYFGQSGEFSPYKDIAFAKHINRLNILNQSPYFNKFNGDRIKVIRQIEPFWY